MRILVTGGAGFIGGHLADRFLDAGHDVVVLDNFDPYYHVGIKERTVKNAKSRAEAADGSYELIEGDVRDEELVHDLVEAADAVYHQAAQAGVRTSIEDPVKPHEINATGTLNLLEAARNTDLQRVVLASSSSVYGKPRSLPYTEDHLTTPVSPYGVSKLAAEQYGRVYAEVYGLPTVSLRYFTVYGPRMRPNMAISNFVSRCANGDPPVVYGDGSQTRDFTYIEDIARVNADLLTTDEADGAILNVGSGERITITELAETVRDRLAPDAELTYDDRPAGDAEHTHADVSKAKDLLGYNPTVDIRTGVNRFIDWYLDNRDWYEPLVLKS